MVPTAQATSNHQSPQASFAKLSPHAGTQTKTIIFTIVASPIGNVPRNKDCTGWRIMQPQTPGNRVYRNSEMVEKSRKSPTFRAKVATEIQYIQSALYGRLCSRMETMPVPMQTLNHEGVKFSTTRRQP